MKGLFGLGIILVVLGIAILAWPAIPYTERKKAVDIGPIEVETETQKHVVLPPLLGHSSSRIGRCPDCARAPQCKSMSASDHTTRRRAQLPRGCPCERLVNAWLQKPIDAPLRNQVIHDGLAPVRIVRHET